MNRPNVGKHDAANRFFCLHRIWLALASFVPPSLTLFLPTSFTRRNGEHLVRNTNFATKKNLLKACNLLEKSDRLHSLTDLSTYIIILINIH